MVLETYPHVPGVPGLSYGYWKSIDITVSWITFRDLFWSQLKS
jgi:hypothetical protein